LNAKLKKLLWLGYPKRDIRQMSPKANLAAPQGGVQLRRSAGAARSREGG